MNQSRSSIATTSGTAGSQRNTCYLAYSVRSLTLNLGFSSLSHTTKRTTPSSDDFRQILGAVSRDLHRLTIVVDALDECETRARQEFLSAVDTLRGQCEVRILATSRFLPAIESHSALLGKPKLEVRASDEDLESYIRSRAGELHGWVVSKPDLFEDLVSSTVGAVGGMCVRSFL